MTDLLWWLAQTSFTIVVLILVSVVACRFLSRWPAVQYALWVVILIKMLTPPIVSWPWSARDVFPSSSTPSLAGDGGEQLNPGASSEFDPPTAVPISSPENGIVETGSQPAFTSQEAGIPAEPEPAKPSVPWREAAVPVLFGIWLLGGVLMLAWQLRSIFRTRRVFAESQAASSRLKKEVQRVADLLAMRPLLIRTSRRIASPIVVCFGWPKLLWPESLVAEIEAYRSVMAHELGHVKRKDHWVAWLLPIASCLWWWNPLFWFVVRRLNESAEMASDALALSILPDERSRYAEALLNLTQRVAEIKMPAPALGAGTGKRQSFKRRFSMILDEQVNAKLPKAGLLAVLLLIAVALPCWAFRGADASETKDATVPLKDIVAGVQAAHEKIKSMKVEYETRIETDGKKALSWEGDSLSIFAYSGDKRYLDFTRPEADGELHRSIAVYDGEVTREIFGQSGGSVNDGRVAPVEWDFYTMQLDMAVANPPGLKRDLTNTEKWLPFALERDGWEVLHQQEQVDGAWCHVLELNGKSEHWNHQKIWIDPKIGFAVRQREFYADKDHKQLKHRRVSQKFVEAAKGVWLPKSIQRESFDANAAKPKVTYTVEITVKKLEVNNVPDELFDVDALDKLKRPLPIPKLALEETETIPMSDEVKTVSIEFNHPPLGDVEFTATAEDWAAIRESLMPAEADNNPPDWEWVGSVRIVRKDGRPYRVELYNPDNGPGAFAAGKTYEERSYFRGGNTTKLNAAIYAALVKSRLREEEPSGAAREQDSPLPTADLVKTISIEWYEHPKLGKVKFTATPDDWRTIRGTLLPAIRDPRPAKWEGLGRVEIVTTDDKPFLVYFYSLSNSHPGAFSAGNTLQQRVYYRGGKTPDITQAIQTAYETSRNRPPSASPR